MLPRIFLTVALVFIATYRLPAQALPAKGELPKVVLIGDSIRLGYAPPVAKKLEGKAVIVSPKDNGADSGNVLKHLEEWVIKEKPAVVHINAGLHDLKFSKKDKRHQVELDQYQANLKAIVDRIRKETDATIIFALTTPIHDERHAQRKADFDRTEAEVKKYNEAAVKVMRDAGVTVHDLHWVVEQGGVDKLLASDGTHYTPIGYDRLADAVADAVVRQLILRQAPKVFEVGKSPDPVAYRKAEAERDALVPKIYKDMKAPALPLASDWPAKRPQLLRAVVQSLGDLPPRPNPQKVRLISREIRPGYTLEKVAIDNGVDDEITALVLVPDKRTKPAPAVLWLHSSTPEKTRIITPNTEGGPEPLGEVLVKLGYVVMSPDAYWHGDREPNGPAGAAEPYRNAQDSLFKLHILHGRTLWGMFVRDDQIALDYLASRPEVDKSRIGATGMSMGSTRSYWLAAVDDRVAATVGVACLTRCQNLIAHGNLRAHGVYFFTNNLLKTCDTEGVIALIAPRPYLALTGDLDYGSPADGIKVVEKEAGRIYAGLGAADKFKSILYADTGHVYSPEMRKETLAWFEKWLKR